MNSESSLLLTRKFYEIEYKLEGKVIFFLFHIQNQEFIYLHTAFILCLFCTKKKKKKITFLQDAGNTKIKKIRFIPFNRVTLQAGLEEIIFNIVGIFLISKGGNDSRRESQTAVEGWGEIGKPQAFGQKVLLAQHKAISHSHGCLESESCRQTTLCVIIWDALAQFQQNCHAASGTDP